jgi:NRPS condensation-like uncharacterized protein
MAEVGQHFPFVDIVLIAFAVLTGLASVMETIFVVRHELDIRKLKKAVREAGRK